MASRELENLAKIGALEPVKGSLAEFKALIARGASRLRDAENVSLAPESRFDLVYGAGYAFALAALRREGFRSENRITVFQCLEHTTDLTAAARKTIISAHRLRNQLEYDAEGLVDTALVENLLGAVGELAKLVRAGAR